MLRPLPSLYTAIAEIYGFRFERLLRELQDQEA